MKVLGAFKLTNACNPGLCWVPKVVFAFRISKGSASQGIFVGGVRDGG